MNPLRLGLTVLLLQPWLVTAADSMYPVAANVETVRTCGYWEAQKQRGRYRVVIAHAGLEHVQTYVRIEWIRGPAPDGSVAVEKAEVLHHSLLGSIGVESVRAETKGTAVVLAGTLHDGSQYRCQLMLATDGSITKGAGC
jgi:hypothetical protein